jgi:hypothetical protein
MWNRDGAPQESFRYDTLVKFLKYHRWLGAVTLCLKNRQPRKFQTATVRLDWLVPACRSTKILAGTSLVLPLS